MRTKTLLLSVAVSAVSVAAAVAQTVYSVNAVGYVNVTVPKGGFALLANPLNASTNNSLANVLQGVPANTVVYVFNTATGGFDSATFRSTGAWTGPGSTALLNPGAGFFIKNPDTANDLNITFVGEVPQGTNLVVNVPAGFSVIASIVPQQGKLETDLGFVAAANDKLYIFDPAQQAYQNAYTKRATGWTGGIGAGEPVINVATGFFYQASAASTWTRSFTVGQ